MIPQIIFTKTVSDVPLCEIEDHLMELPENLPLKLNKKFSLKSRVQKKRKLLMKENIDNFGKSAKKKISPEQFEETVLRRIRGKDEKRKKKIAKLKREIYEESNNHSYRPKINAKSHRNRSRTPLAERVSKILEEKDMKLKDRRKEMTLKKKEAEMKECTFAPKGSTSKKRGRKSVMKSVERLLDWKKARDGKLVENKLSQETEMNKKEKKQKKQKKPNLDLNGVSKRLIQKYEIRKKKIAKQKKEQIEGLFMPTINKKSIKLARCRTSLRKKKNKGVLEGQKAKRSKRSRTPLRKFEEASHMLEFKVTPIRKRKAWKGRIRKNESSISTQETLLKTCKESKNTKRKMRGANKSIEASLSQSDESEEMIDIPISYHSENIISEGGQRIEKKNRKKRHDNYQSIGKKQKNELIGILKELCFDVEQSTKY